MNIDPMTSEVHQFHPIALRALEMIAPGSALHEMVRRPTKNPLLELPEDE